MYGSPVHDVEVGQTREQVAIEVVAAVPVPMLLVPMLLVPMLLVPILLAPVLLAPGAVGPRSCWPSRLVFSAALAIVGLREVQVPSGSGYARLAATPYRPRQRRRVACPYRNYPRPLHPPLDYSPSAAPRHDLTS